MYEGDLFFSNLQFLLGYTRSLQLEDLKLEDEDGTRGDVLASLLVSVGQFGGDDEFPVVTFGHELHSLGPALDYLVGSKGGRLSSLVGRVEFGSVDQCTSVVAFTWGVGLGVYEKS
jgi:hypothetical protein